jgi:hypothetical protein
LGCHTIATNNYDNHTELSKHCNYSTYKVFSVFSSSCLVAAFIGGRSSSCGLTELPRPSSLTDCLIAAGPASTVILDSESHRTHGHILLSECSQQYGAFLLSGGLGFHLQFLLALANAVMFSAVESISTCHPFLQFNMSALYIVSYQISASLWTAIYSFACNMYIYIIYIYINIYNICKSPLSKSCPNSCSLC